ncbi:hypothetical protein V8E54_000883 [Elaphomyces granulatus]
MPITTILSQPLYKRDFEKKYYKIYGTKHHPDERRKHFLWQFAFSLSTLVLTGLAAFSILPLTTNDIKSKASRRKETQSPRGDMHLGVLRSGNATVVFDCKVLHGKRLLLLRTSATRSGIWLGVQGFLALLRVLFWVKRPDFQRRSNLSFEIEPGSSSFNDISPWKRTFTELELVLLWSEGAIDGFRRGQTHNDRDCLHNNKDCLRIPRWVVDSLWSSDLTAAFDLSRRVKSGSVSHKEINSILQVGPYRKLPAQTFGRFLISRNNLRVESVYPAGAEFILKRHLSPPSVNSTRRELLTMEDHLRCYLQSA